MSIEQTIGDRIKARRTELGLTQKELATRSGVSQSAIALLEVGKRKKSGDLAQIAATLGISSLYLATGRGTRTDGEAAEIAASFFKVPVTATCMFLEETCTQKFTSESPRHLNFLHPDPEVFAVLIRGSGLTPRIQDHQYVVLSPSTPPAPGDLVMLQRKGGETLIQELLSADDLMVSTRSLSGETCSFMRSDLIRLDRISQIAARGELLQ